MVNNADKPQLWKADVAAMVDPFNDWLLRHAPEAYRSTRPATAESVR